MQLHRRPLRGRLLPLSGAAVRCRLARGVDASEPRLAISSSRGMPAARVPCMQTCMQPALRRTAAYVGTASRPSGRRAADHRQPRSGAKLPDRCFTSWAPSPCACRRYRRRRRSGSTPGAPQAQAAALAGADCRWHWSAPAVGACKRAGGEGEALRLRRRPEAPQRAQIEGYACCKRLRSSDRGGEAATIKPASWQNVYRCGKDAGGGPAGSSSQFSSLGAQCTPASSTSQR